MFFLYYIFLRFNKFFLNKITPLSILLSKEQPQKAVLNMCYGCCDSEKKAKAILKGTNCDQTAMWKMSIDELKYRLTIESLNTGKTEFTIFREAIINELASNNISWAFKKNLTEQTIQVKFL